MLPLFQYIPEKNHHYQILTIYQHLGFFLYQLCIGRLLLEVYKTYRCLNFVNLVRLFVEILQFSI